MSEPTWELLGGGGVVGGPIDYVGDWAAGTQYQPGQVVRHGGVDYLAVNPSLGQTPPASSLVPQTTDCLYDEVLAANAGSLGCLAIPQGYRHLKVVATLRSPHAAVATTGAIMRFNADAAANYHYHNVRSNVAALSAVSAASVAQFYIGEMPAATAAANRWSQHIMEIADYASSTHVKCMTGINYCPGGDSTTSTFGHWLSGVWIGTAPVTRLDLYTLTGGQQISAGSRLTIYGLRGL